MKEEVQKRKFPFRARTSKGAFILLMVFIVLLIFSTAALASIQTRKGLQAASQRRLEFKASQAMSRLDVHMRGIMSGLSGTVGFFAGSEDVTRKEFYDFIRSSGIRDVYAGLSTFAHIERVPSGEKEDFIESNRNDRTVVPDGYPDFSITPEGDREEYWPITYIDPEIFAESLLGVDQRAEAARRANLELARDSGAPAISRIITLNPNGRSGAIVAVPLYAEGSVPDTVEERRSAFVGASAIAIHVDEFFDAVFPDDLFGDRPTDVAIFEEGVAPFLDLTPFYLHPTGSFSDPLWSGLYGEVRYEETYEIGERTWSVVFTGRPGYGLSAAEIFLPFAILFLGILLAAISAMALASIRRIGLVDLLRRENELLKQRQDTIRTLSHQLRTPLTGMHWGLEALQETGRKKERESIAREVTGKVTDLSGIVDRLLFYLETEEGYEPRGKTMTSLGDLCREVVSGLNERAVQTGVAMSVAIGEDVSVSVDARELHRALSYLVENAVVYNRKGGTVEVGVSERKSFAEIRVKDTGIGIPENEQERPLKELFRAKNASETKNVGSGVSLIIAKTIIESHGGSLAFTSKEDVGTVFTVRLPLRG